MNITELTNRVNALQGKVGLYYKNLVTGEAMSVNSGAQFEAASLPKLAILLLVLKMAEEGEISLHDKVVIRESQKVGGCGAIKSMTGDVELEVLDVCKLMITISDNTATNAMIRFCGLERIAKEWKTWGLEITRLEREYFDDEAHERGLRNYVCPEEIGHLLEKIYERSFVSENVSAMAEEILMAQQIRHKIPGYIGRSFPIANKTGESTGVTHDGAIVFAEREPFVLVVCSEHTDVPETERFIREIALEFYEENK